MSHHPDYYTDLLQRQLAGDPTLTPRQRRELDLHLLICPLCNWTALTWLQEREFEQAAQAARRLEGCLIHDAIVPFLPELAEALHAACPLDAFQQLLWAKVQQERALMAQLRLQEALVTWQRR